MSHTAKNIWLPTLLSLAIASSLTSCGGGGGSSSTATGTGTGTGILSLSITDAPVDGAENVVVEFTGVEIKPSGGNSFSIDFAQPQQIDLLSLTGGTAEILLDGEVLAAGDYEWLRLKVNAEIDNVYDSYIVLNGGAQHELEVPSGSQTGLKLNRPITIPEDGSTSFTIDFDLRKSIHEANGEYKLRPTLRLIDNTTDGALSGTVDAGTIATACVGNGGDVAAVYVFEDAGTTPDDINIYGNDVEPVATAIVDWQGADNTYTIAFLPAGSYTAAFTCDAGIDDPAVEDTLSFVGSTDITISAGQTTTLDF